MVEPLLRIRNLTIRFHGCEKPAVASLDLDLNEGETLGLLGESGAGKSTLARALLGLLTPGEVAVEGSVRFREVEMLRANESVLQSIRGAQVSLISQEPELGLNPFLRVVDQVDEVLRAHTSLDRRRRRKRVEEVLTAAGLSDRELWRAYPHQLSGGQRQRVVTAQALVCKPALLIADEPTSALDNVVQAGITAMLKELTARFDLALLFITHDPALLNGLTERVMVMNAGRVIETGTLEQVYLSPQHAYTASVLNSIPALPPGASQ